MKKKVWLILWSFVLLTFSLGYMGFHLLKNSEIEREEERESKKHVLINDHSKLNDDNAKSARLSIASITLHKIGVVKCGQ